MLSWEMGHESLCAAGESGEGWGLQAKQGNSLENKKFFQKLCKDLIVICEHLSSVTSEYKHSVIIGN